MEFVPRRGQRYTLVVRPLDWYAGSVGSGATIEEVSATAIYVLFDGGLRESFPPARFLEYFRPEESTAVSKVASSTARPLARGSLHR